MQTNFRLGGTEMLGRLCDANPAARQGQWLSTSVDLIAPGGMGTFDLIAPAMAYTDYLLPNEDQVLGFTGAACFWKRAPGCCLSHVAPTAW